MKPAGVVFLHGYGVRSTIWTTFREQLGTRLGEIALADLTAESLTDLISRAKARVRRHSLEMDAPVTVIGHSLGAVLAAIAAGSLGPEVVSAAIMIAPPFGEREHVPGRFLQFLLRRRLIPPFLLRPRFFSRHTPRHVQRQVFRSAVPEAPAIQALTFERQWFHTSFFPEPLPQPSLVVASHADRIVPVSQSLEFARVVGAQVHVFPADERIGHDDLFASPSVVARLVSVVTDFVDAL